MSGLFFAQERSRALSPIHRAFPKGYQTGRLTAGFGGGDRPKRALACFLAQGVGHDSQLAKADDEKEAKAP